MNTYKVEMANRETQKSVFVKATNEREAELLAGVIMPLLFSRAPVVSLDTKTQVSLANYDEVIFCKALGTFRLWEKDDIAPIAEAFGKLTWAVQK